MSCFGSEKSKAIKHLLSTQIFLTGKIAIDNVPRSQTQVNELSPTMVNFELNYYLHM